MPTDLAETVDRILRETSFQSLSTRVEIDQPRRMASRAEAERSREITYTIDYAATDRGQRFLDMWYDIKDNPDSRITVHCDGKKCANIVYERDDWNKQKLALIGHNFGYEPESGMSLAPPPFRYHFVGLVPLHEAIATAERVGTETVLGRSCGQYLFRDVRINGADQHCLYSLDGATSVPLKVAIYNGDEHYREAMPSQTWEALSLDQVAGRHLPRESRYMDYQVSRAEDGQLVRKPDIRQDIRVTKVTFDQPIPASTFWPVLQPGDSVDDRIPGRDYTVPGAPTPRPEVSTQAAQPIRVDDPSRGSWWAGGIGLVGLTMIAIAIVVRMYRR